MGFTGVIFFVVGVLPIYTLSNSMQPSCFLQHLQEDIIETTLQFHFFELSCIFVGAPWISPPFLTNSSLTGKSTILMVWKPGKMGIFMGELLVYQRVSTFFFHNLYGFQQHLNWPLMVRLGMQTQEIFGAKRVTLWLQVNAISLNFAIFNGTE